MIDTTNRHTRQVVCPDGEVRQLIGYDDKDAPTIATVIGDKGRGYVYKVEDLEEYEQHKSR